MGFHGISEHPVTGYLENPKGLFLEDFFVLFMGHRLSINGGFLHLAMFDYQRVFFLQFDNQTWQTWQCLNPMAILVD